MPGKVMVLVTNKPMEKKLSWKSTLATPITQYTKFLTPLPSTTTPRRLYNSPPKGKGKTLRACVWHAFKRSSPNLKCCYTTQLQKEPTSLRGGHMQKANIFQRWSYVKRLCRSGLLLLTYMSI